MSAEHPNERPRLDDFVAALTEAVYPVALRHQASEPWLDLELDLWQVMARTVQQWEGRGFVQPAR